MIFFVVPRLHLIFSIFNPVYALEVVIVFPMHKSGLKLRFYHEII